MSMSCIPAHLTFHCNSVSILFSSASNTGYLNSRICLVLDFFFTPASTESLPDITLTHFPALIFRILAAPFQLPLNTLYFFNFLPSCLATVQNIRMLTSILSFRCELKPSSLSTNCPPSCSYNWFFSIWYSPTTPLKMENQALFKIELCS